MQNTSLDIKLPESHSDLFVKYLDNCKDKVKSKSTEGYYHVDVVAEAYTQGFSDGEKSGQRDFMNNLLSNHIEQFTQKANQIYILSKNVISLLDKNGYNANGLYINLTFDRPRVVISLPNEHLNNDECIEMAYSKIIENQKIFSKLFNDPLDMGLIASDYIEESLLKEDGFGYQENY